METLSLELVSTVFFKKSEKKIIKQSDSSDRDPLHGNGHRIL